MSERGALGAPTPRVDGADKVTGAARYAADQIIPGALVGRLLHSSRSHARIVSIDASAARALDGVHAVITGDDIDGQLYGRRIKDMPVLARGRVLYAGERVAAVAAESDEIAREAVSLIDVEYEELPAVFDIAEALEADAPLLHPDFATYPGARAREEASNAYIWTTMDRGDLDAGFALADVIVENEYDTPRVHQAYLEPHVSIVSVEDDRTHVWTNTKAPQAIRDVLAFTSGRPRDEILLHHSHIGGDFGGKGTPLNLAVCYYLSRAAGRPVRMVSDYIEEFMAGSPRHATRVKLRTGVTRDGDITAHHAQFFVNCGAYAGYKPAGAIGGGVRAAGPYRTENSRVESVQVYTNTVPGGHMRAPGTPQALFALESHIDEVAAAVGMDPLDFRRRNVVRDGDESAAGSRFTNPRALETIDAAAAAAGYGDPVPPNVGRGIAIGDHGAGGGVGNAEITLFAEGGAELTTPIFDQGSGTHTMLQQIVADEFGIATDDVRVRIWDTDGTENDAGVGGSRAARVNSVAAHAAVEDTRRVLLDLAATALERDRASLRQVGADIRDGDEVVARWADLLRDQGRGVTGRAQIEESGGADVTAFVAQVAEVEVDPETGAVHVLRFTTAHDVGRVLNPIGHQGQIDGGVVQGLGYALMEQLPVEDGRVTALSFGDYKIPTALDIPPLTTVLVEAGDGLGPYQIKSIGETPNIPVAAAVANAVAAATGARVRSLPLTAERVFRALHADGGA